MFSLLVSLFIFASLLVIYLLSRDCKAISLEVLLSLSAVLKDNLLEILTAIVAMVCSQGVLL